MVLRSLYLCHREVARGYQDIMGVYLHCESLLIFSVCSVTLILFYSALLLPALSLNSRQPFVAHVCLILYFPLNQIIHVISNSQ